MTPLSSVAKPGNPVAKHTEAVAKLVVVGGVPDHDAGRQEAFFDGLQPLVYVVAGFGILPVAFRPLRVSFDPGSSTLVYALVVQAVVCWSAWRAYLAHLMQADDLAASLDGPDWSNAFVAAHSIIHLTGWLITPVLWLESRRIRALDPTCRRLMELFGADWCRRGLPGRKHRRWVLALACSFVVLSLHVLWWSTMVEFTISGLIHMPAHMYINVLIMYGASVPMCCCIWMRDFTIAVARQLRKELNQGDVTAERVWMFRCCWTNLAALSTGLIATPVTMLMLVVLVVVLCTCHAYEVIVQLADGKSNVAFAIMGTGLPYFTLIFILCDIPHRSADAIRKNFLEVLQCSSYNVTKEVRYYELRSFLEVVLWDFPVTTIGGYFDLRRSSLNTIFAVIITYVVVILQFQLSSRYAGCTAVASNASRAH